MLRGRGVGVALAGLGAGTWLAAEPERPARVQAYLASAARAGRLAVTCARLAVDYKRAAAAARLDDEQLRADERLHRELQRDAGKAEQARIGATGADVDAAEAHAYATRQRSARFGETLAARRVQREQESGAAARWAALHEAGASALLSLCLANGGIYVKLGQHVAQLDYLVPAPYTRTLAALFECNVASEWDAVASTIADDLGAHPDELFDGFERTPIASASLAQVHRATERGSGRPLAVKVQHAWLRETCAADMVAVSAAVSFAKWLFPDDFTLQWLVDEMRTLLPQELDFEHEAANAAHCRAFFSADGPGADLAAHVVVPEVVQPLTSKRVLTMSFEEGVSVTDRAAIERRGLAVSSVVELLSETFMAMVFRGAFVHADPHPGNVLVRPAPRGASDQPQLVLLDHGLYRHFSPAFAGAYARLWRAIVLGDADAIARQAQGLGVGEYYPLLAAMLTSRPWSDVIDGGADGRLQERGTVEDAAQIRSYAVQYARAIGVVLGRVPRPMLLLFKTNDCLRHSERALGTGVNSVVITLRFCLEHLRDSSLHAARELYLLSGGAGGDRGGARGAGRRSRLRAARACLARAVECAQLAVCAWLLRVCARSSLLPALLSVVSRARVGARAPAAPHQEAVGDGEGPDAWEALPAAAGKGRGRGSVHDDAALPREPPRTSLPVPAMLDRVGYR